MVAEATGVVDLSGWPPGLRLIVCGERPYPGAQLRFTDHDGLCLTAFVTNISRGQVPELERRHRRRARITCHARRARLRLAAHAPWTHLLIDALTKFKALPAPT